jgi:hypothetical protein
LPARSEKMWWLLRQAQSLFLPRFKPWLIKPIWVFQDGQISFRVAKPSGKGLCTRNGYAEFNTTGAKVLSNAWLISPKIDMDTHTNEILTFRTAQHHLDVDSPLNSRSFVILTDWMLRRQRGYRSKWFYLNRPPWYQFVGSGGSISYTGKINIALGTPAGKTLLWIVRCRFWKCFKNKNFLWYCFTAKLVIYWLFIRSSLNLGGTNGIQII